MDILAFEFDLNKLRSTVYQNVEWFNQGRFMSQIVEQIPAFASSTNLIREVKKVSRNFLSRKIILIRTV